MLQRRSLFSFLAALPVIGLLAPKAKAVSAPPLTGLAARRQEAIRMFTMGLDHCIKAEQAFYTGEEPKELFVMIRADYGNRKTIVSKPVAVFLPNATYSHIDSGARARDAEGLWKPE